MPLTPLDYQARVEVPARMNTPRSAEIYPSESIFPTRPVAESALLYSLKSVKESRGNLVVGEYLKELPFQPHRIFMVSNVPSGQVRGDHAHKTCHQMLIAAHGCLSVLLDDGHSRQEYELSDPQIGLHIKPGVWGLQYRFSEAAVLLVLASHGYDPSDYIRDYDEFLGWKINQK